MRGRRSGAAGVALQVATLREVIRSTDILPGYALGGPAGAPFLGGSASRRSPTASGAVRSGAAGRYES